MTLISQKSHNPFLKVLSSALAVSLAITPNLAYAQPFQVSSLPLPGTMIFTSPAFVPILLKGMTLHPDDPLRFDFIIDSGSSKENSARLQEESTRLVKYFLASMTIPKNDLWVNLSPEEPDQIIPDELAKTELGRDMLAQDYLLKQLSASLLYPEKDLGDTFWKKIYAEAKKRFGTSEIPVNTFNKVWIIPEKAVVYEHDNTVYIVESRLKVMLDSDYTVWQKNKDNPAFSLDQTTEDDEFNQAELSAQIIREIIIPEIEKEVNEGENFAPLRQIYHSLILAKWYKETVKQTLLSKVYVDQNKVDGIEVDDETFKDQIYNRYMDAYKQGVFNYIKEDYDALSQEMIPRKYLSGGITDANITIGHASSAVGVRNSIVGETSQLSLRLAPKGKAGASNTVTEDEIWDGFGSKLGAILNDPELIQSALKNNRDRFLNDQISYGLTASLTKSLEYLERFKSLQMKVAEILNDQEKLNNPSFVQTQKAMYVPSNKAHVTLVGELFFNWKQSGRAAAILLEELAKVKPTVLTLQKPYLTDSLAVIYRLTNDTGDLNNLKQAIGERFKQFNDRVRAGPIYHSSVVFIKNATPQELMKLREWLAGPQASELPSINVPINSAYITEAQMTKEFVEFKDQIDFGGKSASSPIFNLKKDSIKDMATLLNEMDALGKTGTFEAMNQLASQLYDPAPVIRSQALLVLGKYFSEKELTGNLLIEKLIKGDKDALILKQIMALLIKVRNDNSVNLLSNIAGRLETHPDSRREIYKFLGDMGERQAAPYLKRIIQGIFKDEHRMDALNALLKLDPVQARALAEEIVAAKSSESEAMREFASTLLKSQDTQVASSPLSDEEGHALLFKLNSINELDISEYLAEFLSKHEQKKINFQSSSYAKEITNALLRLIKTQARGKIYSQLDELLMAIDDPASQEALVKAIENSDQAIQSTAISYLGSKGDASAAQLLVDKLKQTRGLSMRETIVIALGNIGNSIATETLIAQFDRQPSFETLEVSIIEALGKLWDQKALIFLVQKLTHENKYVRAATVDVLGQWRNPETFQFLINMLNDPSLYVRASVVRALGEIGDSEVIKPLADMRKTLGFTPEEESLKILINKVITHLSFKTELKDTSASNPVSSDDQSSIVNTPGGIDMNEIPVERQGEGISMPFDELPTGTLLNMPITGFAPVIINIQPLPNILPLLGLDETTPEKMPALSSL
jgi:HEAT repeat protein